MYGTICLPLVFKYLELDRKKQVRFKLLKSSICLMASKYHTQLLLRAVTVERPLSVVNCHPLNILSSPTSRKKLASDIIYLHYNLCFIKDSMAGRERLIANMTVTQASSIICTIQFAYSEIHSC